MRTYPLIREGASQPFAFEIDNALLGTVAMARLLSEVEGVSDVRPRRMFSKSDEIHVEFKFNGQPYIVWEPFGDNSRYWIGPESPEEDSCGIGAIEAVFKSHKHTICGVVVDLLRLRSWTSRL